MPNNSGALGMKSGDRIRCLTTGRTGVADEFLQDGEAFVSWDDGTCATVKWTSIAPEHVFDDNPKPEQIPNLDMQIMKPRKLEI